MGIIIYLIGFVLYDTWLSFNVPKQISYTKIVLISILYPLIISVEVLGIIFLRLGIYIRMEISVNPVSNDEED